jgi:predicted kinase
MILDKGDKDIFDRVVIIIRGCSGSNKSTFAEYIAEFAREAMDNDYCVVVCSADDYFIKDGIYKFDKQKISLAHAKCRDKFTEAIEKKTPLIIVANTNVRTKEFQFYVDWAKENDYKIFVIVMENYNNSKDIHGCPEETLIKQEQLLRENLKLR